MNIIKEIRKACRITNWEYYDQNHMDQLVNFFKEKMPVDLDQSIIEKEYACFFIKESDEKEHTVAFRKVGERFNCDFKLTL